MKLSDYISNDNLDKMSPEELQASMDAIEAILGARTNNGTSMPPMEDAEVEVDPELELPNFGQNDDDDDDVEIDDPDDVLKDMKQKNKQRQQQKNKSSKSKNKNSGQKSEPSDEDNSTDEDNDLDIEDDSFDDTDAGDEDELDDSNSEESGREGNGKSKKSQKKNGDSSDDADSNESDDAEEEDETNSESGSNKNNTTNRHDKGQSNDTENNDSADAQGGSDEDDFGDDGELSDDDSDGGDGGPEDENEDAEDESDFDWDEDEFGPVTDDDFDTRDAEKAELGKQRAVQRSRTASLGDKTLEYGKRHNVPQDKLDKLQKALDKLKSFNREQLETISEEDFDKALSEVLDACDAIHKVNYTPNVEGRIEQIKNDVDSGQMQAEINAEDSQQGQSSSQGIKAHANEINKYKPRPMSSFKLNFYRAIKDQVEYQDDETDSWAVPNRHSDETGILKPGILYDPVKNNSIPTIDVYIDQSSSWGQEDVQRAQQAIQVISDFKNKGQVKVNIFYFDDELATDASMLSSGGTGAWPKIAENIIANKTKNVVLVTDRDMEYQGLKKTGPVIVPGYVWFIWKDGRSVSSEIPKKLRGKKGNSQYILYSD